MEIPLGFSIPEIGWRYLYPETNNDMNDIRQNRQKRFQTGKSKYRKFSVYHLIFECDILFSERRSISVQNVYKVFLVALYAQILSLYPLFVILH